MGLSITTLLKGGVKLIDHPKKYKPYWVHLLWAFYIFILLIHFWWWEIRLKAITQWVFTEYLFIVFYVILYYVLCVLIFPDDVSDYESFEEYFYSRKKWFFSVLSLVFAADFIDTFLKGKQYVQHLLWEYPVRNIVHIILCLIAIKISNKRFHAILVILFIIYELSFILRVYYNT
jgi:hypothetical protein